MNMLTKEQWKWINTFMKKSELSTHKTDFFRHMGLNDFVVLKGVLSPEKSMLSSMVAEYLFNNKKLYENADVLDLGCGSGILTVLMAKHGARKVVATDMLGVCVRNTKKNSAYYGLDGKIDVRKGDMYNPVKKNEKFDLIVFNVPFFYGEPINGNLLSHAFLDKGHIIRDLMEISPFHIRGNGRIITTFSDIAGKENHPQIKAKKYGYHVKIVAELEVDYGRNMIYEIRQKEIASMLSEKVWELTKRIPRGKVTTYGEMARRLGMSSPRAVGQALKRNPHAPVVPCHRVVKSDGSIGGYGGCNPGRIREKALLLESESVKVHNKKVDLIRYSHKF